MASKPSVVAAKPTAPPAPKAATAPVKNTTAAKADLVTIAKQIRLIANSLPHPGITDSQMNCNNLNKLATNIHNIADKL